MSASSKPAAFMLANVGVRDLKKGPNHIEKANIRKESKRILDDFDRYIDALSAPILTPLIEHVMADSRPSLVMLYLFGTDQHEDSPYHASDTLYCARILNRLLPHLFPKSSIGALQGSPVKIPDPPADYDRMYSYFNKKLRSKTFAQLHESDSPVYVCVSGGTPAMNFGLMYNALRYFGRRCIQLSAKDGHAQRSRIGLELDRQWRSQSAEPMLERFDFAALGELYDEDECISVLAEAASARLHFDRKRAKGKFEHLTGYPHLRDLADRQLASLNASLQGDMQEILTDLAFTMEMSINRGELVDFIARVYRFIEGLLWYTTKKLFSIDENSYVPWVSSHAELLNLLERDRINWKPKKTGDAPNTFALSKLLEFGSTIQQPENLFVAGTVQTGPHTCKEAVGFYKKVEGLRDLRNRVVHTGKEVELSVDNIRRLYDGGKSDLCEDVWNVLAQLGIPRPRLDPYKEVLDAIRREVKRA